MKTIIYLLLASVILLASCGKEKKFDESLKVAYQKMGKTTLISTLVASQISDTWRTAIFDNKTPSGKYCSDFNEALSELMNTYHESGIMDSVAKYKEEMLTATSKLNNPPSARKDCYDDFVAIVGEVSSLSRLATDPSGNLRSYSDQLNETAENISKKIDQFKIKYSEFINDDEPK